MTQITLWSRDRAVGVSGAAAAAELVAVVYSTFTIPPRPVLLPLGNYREGTEAERRATPQLRLYPVDQAAQEAELKAIRADLDKVAASAPPTLEVP